MSLWYVDNAASGANNGTSWTDAWTSYAGITGLSAGDTVYFSGGSSGKTYSTPADWAPAGGSVGNPITYAVGQDAGHTAMVTFTRSGSTARNAFLYPTLTSYVTINGEVSGQRRMTIDNTFPYVMYTLLTSDRNIKLLYLEWDGPIIVAHGGSYEIGYCHGIAPITAPDDSFISYIGDGGTSGYGVNSIHHNYFEVPRLKTLGRGFDTLKWIVNCDVHHNVLISKYNASYAGTQHNDCIQTAGEYMRVYSNWFENFIGIGILHEMYGDTGRWRIYNNVFYSDEAGVDWTAYRPGYAKFFASPFTVSDYIVANNTMIGGPSNNTAHLNGYHFNETGAGTIGADCYIVNNLAYDFLDECVVVEGPGTATVSNNIFGTTNLALANVSPYPTGDAHLTASATAAIDGAINPAPAYLTNLFTTDADGYQRNVGAWDIGAYEFGAGAPPSPVVIARVLRWMEVAAFVTGIGWHFRKALLAVCLAAISLGGTMWPF